MTAVRFGRTTEQFSRTVLARSEDKWGGGKTWREEKADVVW
jgi:hypothetical protein